MTTEANKRQEVAADYLDEFYTKMKRALSAKPPLDAVVHSSGGDLYIDATTGRVLRVDLSGPEADLSAIVSFDLEEFYAHYKHMTPGSALSFDILDVGYTYSLPDGGFASVSAESSWRKEVAESLGFVEELARYVKTPPQPEGEAADRLLDDLRRIQRWLADVSSLSRELQELALVRPAAVVHASAIEEVSHCASDVLSGCIQRVAHQEGGSQ